MARRTDIRNALASAIGTLGGINVYVARSLPLTDAELPAILVFSGESDVLEYDTEGEPATQRWRLRADVLVPGGASGEAVADDLLDQMRAAVSASSVLHDGQTSCVYAGVGEVDIDDSLQKPALRLPVQFEVTYL